MVGNHQDAIALGSADGSPIHGGGGGSALGVAGEGVRACLNRDVFTDGKDRSGANHQ